MNDIDEEGMYVWTDGSPVTYIKFDPGQPNNAHGGEDCVVLGSVIRTHRKFHRPCMHNDVSFHLRNKHSVMFD